MFRRRLGLALTAGVCILIPSRLIGQQPAKSSDAANVVLARRLLEAMHQGDNIIAGIESAMAAQRRQQSQVPAVFYDSLLVRMKRTVPEVLDSLAPGYARRFKSSELQEMIRFFESPSGQALATQQADLSGEAVLFGQRWGARLAAALMKDLVDAGIDITKP